MLNNNLIEEDLIINPLNGYSVVANKSYVKGKIAYINCGIKKASGVFSENEDIATISTSKNMLGFIPLSNFLISINNGAINEDARVIVYLKNIKIRYIDTASANQIYISGIVCLY